MTAAWVWSATWRTGDTFDLVFLDNLMDDMLGIQVARRLRELDYRGPLVFISSTDAYAVAGYEVAAAAYLLKPYDYETVAAVLDKFLPETAAWRSDMPSTGVPPWSSCPIGTFYMWKARTQSACSTAGTARPTWSIRR